MNSQRKQKPWISFIAGVAGGVLLYHAVLLVNDLAVAPRQEMVKQEDLVEQLQEENQQLYDELFSSWDPLVLLLTAVVWPGNAKNSFAVRAGIRERTGFYSDPRPSFTLTVSLLS